MFLIEVNKSVLVKSTLTSSVKLVLILLVFFITYRTGIKALSYYYNYKRNKIFNLITKIGSHNKSTIPKYYQKAIFFLFKCF